MTLRASEVSGKDSISRARDAMSTLGLELIFAAQPARVHFLAENTRRNDHEIDGPFCDLS